MKRNPIQKIEQYMEGKLPLTLTASLITSLFLTINTPTVLAEEVEAPKEEPVDSNSDHQYHSLLENNTQMTEALANLDDLTFNDQNLVSDHEALKELQTTLINELSVEEQSEIISELKSPDLTFLKFKKIFDDLFSDTGEIDESAKDEQTESEELEKLEDETEDSGQEDKEPSEPSTEDEEDLENAEEEPADPADKEADLSEPTKAEETVEEKPAPAQPEKKPDKKPVTENKPAKKEKAQAATVQMHNAKPAVAKTAQLANKEITYVIQPGDTLHQIARRFQTTAQELARLNNISNINLIRVGQRLIIQTDGEKLEDLELGKVHSKHEFIDILGSYAQTVAQEQQLYASVMIAQAALETGFGQSGLSRAPNYNLYGMKGKYQGSSVLMPTKEYSASKGWYNIHAHFKKYPSYLESLLDHASYIRRGPSWAPNYYAGVWLENASSYQDATASLQGRYATDPNYANKLNTIIKNYNLTRFDEQGDLVGGETQQPTTPDNQPNKPVKPSTGGQESHPGQTSVYRVKRGDTLSKISRQYQMTVKELKDLNNLRSDLILVGQQLKVKQVNNSNSSNAPSVEKPSTSTQQNYRVKRGDTLSKIARDYKMSVKELKDMNHLRSDLIIVGQTLKVKQTTNASKPSKPKPKPTPAPSISSNKKTYTVRAGDTLSKIARQHKTTVRELKRLNNLKSDLILVNQKLAVSAEQKTQATTKRYRVKKGDTLYGIARSHKTTVQAIQSKNKLSSTLIRIGQQLIL